MPDRAGNAPVGSGPAPVHNFWPSTAAASSIDRDCLAVALFSGSYGRCADIRGSSSDVVENSIYKTRSIGSRNTINPSTYRLSTRAKRLTNIERIGWREE
jgi:hypothetical protein